MVSVETALGFLSGDVSPILVRRGRLGDTELRPCALVLGSSAELGQLPVGTVAGSGLRAENWRVLMQT